MQKNIKKISELYNKTHDRYVISFVENWKYTRVLKSLWVRKYENGRDFPNWYILHHIDKDRKNDTIENLMLVTRWEHNKLHADDENHHMFRKWHSYWNKPKSEEHKKNIKDAHIRRANKKRDIHIENVIPYIKDNPNCLPSDIMYYSGALCSGHFKRRFWIWFLELKRIALDE